MPFMNEVLKTPIGAVVSSWPFGAIAPIRSLHGITGAAARSDKAVPFGLRQGASDPSGCITRLRRAASSSDFPPPLARGGELGGFPPAGGVARHPDPLRIGGAIVHEPADQLLRVASLVAG